MYTTKPIARDSVPGALAKAERYRLLNEPGEAESICEDILHIQPDNEQARITLLLALTDQIADHPEMFAAAMSAVPHFDNAYDRAYYSGIAWERRAKARHKENKHGSKRYVHEWLVKALRCFEDAERLRPAGNDDAVLRWNACVRFLQRHDLMNVQSDDDVRDPIVSE
jgi:hypothetical protein